MVKTFNTIFNAPDTGGEGSTVTLDTNESDLTKKNVEPNPEDNRDAEIEELKKQVAQYEKDKAEKAKKAEEAKKAKMTEEERRKAEFEEERNALYEEHIMLRLKAVGLDESYKELFVGSSTKEIQEKGELVEKLINKIKAETEARVKKESAHTGAPGVGGVSEEMNEEDYYKSIMENR